MLRLATLPEALLLSGRALLRWPNRLWPAKRSSGWRGIAVLRGFRRSRRWFYARLPSSAVWTGVSATPALGAAGAPHLDHLLLGWHCLLGWQCRLASDRSRLSARPPTQALARPLPALRPIADWIGCCRIQRAFLGCSFLARSRTRCLRAGRKVRRQRHLPGRAAHLRNRPARPPHGQVRAKSKAVSDGASEATVSLGGCIAAGGGSGGFGRRSMR